MKLTIKQNILLNHLNNVIRGISNKNLIPILNCIKFELTKEGLYLSSTDNEIAIKTFIPKKEITKIESNGEIVVSGRFIYEIIKKLPNEDIVIEEAVDSKLLIYNNSISFNLNLNKVKEFPTLEMDEHNQPIKIDKKLFKNIISQTSFATSNQESRPILTGINFKLNNHKLEITATDSYRLARKTIELNEKIKESINIVIPNKNLVEVSRMISNDHEKIEIHIFTNKIIFKFDNITIMSRLINGTYPDTSSSIPENYKQKMILKLDEFYKAIDRASLLTNEDDKNTIKLINKENEITISSNIPEIGNVEEKLIIEKENKENIKTAFSSVFMLDALKSFESDEIEILFNGEIKPIIIKSTTDDNLIQLISPIRTS
jgi:DNA polymerase-3 subunit beta